VISPLEKIVDSCPKAILKYGDENREGIVKIREGSNHWQFLLIKRVGCVRVQRAWSIIRMQGDEESGWVSM